MDVSVQQISQRAPFLEEGLCVGHIFPYRARLPRPK